MTPIYILVIIVIIVVIIIGIAYFLRKKSRHEGFKSNQGSNILVYYINLDRRPDRNQKFINDIKDTIFKDNYQRFSAVDGKQIAKNNVYFNRYHRFDLQHKSGWIGCAESHIALWKICVEKNRHMLIFEDDPVFKPGYNKNMKIALTHLPKEYDIVYFHVNNKVEHIPYSNYFDKIIKHNYSTTNYIVSPRGAKKLLEHLSPYKPSNQIDILITKITEQGWISAYIFMLPTIYTIQDYSESDTQSKKNLVKIHDFHSLTNHTT